MYKQNKPTALIISLIMLFSTIFTPFSVVHASAPDIKIPIQKLNKIETPARAQGVTHKLKPGVEKLPADMNYNLEQITLDDLVNYEGATKVTEEETIDPNKLKGIKYNPGSTIFRRNKDNLIAYN